MLPKRGRPPVTFMMTIERELTRGEILGLATMNTQPLVAPPIIQRLREVHHRAARLVASGKSNVDVALAVGRTPQRISDLTRDPAFRELVAYYETQIEEVEISDAQRARIDYGDINDLARGEIIDRLENKAKLSEIPVDELRRLMVDTGDRTHTPPKVAATVVSLPSKITFNIGTRDLRPANETKVIEHEDVTESQDDDQS